MTVLLLEKVFYYWAYLYETLYSYVKMNSKYILFRQFFYFRPRFFIYFYFFKWKAWGFFNFEGRELFFSITLFKLFSSASITRNSDFCFYLETFIMNQNCPKKVKNIFSILKKLNQKLKKLSNKWSISEIPR